MRHGRSYATVVIFGLPVALPNAQFLASYSFYVVYSQSSLHNEVQ